MIVDLFAGPGGWSEGLRSLGLADIGIELDPWACATRVAAGHATVRADVSDYPAARFAGADGVIASPPCPDWSIAGSGAGRAGKSGHLIDAVPAWVAAVRPRWVACEQVPPALGVWREHAATYRSLGYSTWCGTLDAADYGVAQNRERAILIACLDGLAAPPVPTHGEHPATLLGALRPWVSLGEALNLGHDGVVFTGTNSMLGRGQRRRYRRPIARPAPTVDSKAGRCWWVDFPDGTRHKVETADTLTLQSFRPDYPVQGDKQARQLQIGNAVPPLLAMHVVAAASGRTLAVAA